jgi:two-component system chemotaxis response regulator CheY
MLMRLFHPTLIEPTIRAVAYRLERRCTLAYSIYPIVESVAWRIKYPLNRKSGRMKRILIVDDSPVIRRALRTLFERQGEWVVCGEAPNGRDGIDQALKLQPDLVVIDLIMPVMNGIEATRSLKRLMPAIPLVMFTTFADSFLAKEALTAGVDALVPKSEGTTTLIHSIKKLMVSELPPPASAA